MNYSTLHTSDFINNPNALEYVKEQIIDNTYIHINIDTYEDVDKLITLLNKFLLDKKNINYSDLKHLTSIEYKADKDKEENIINHIWDTVLTEQIKYYIHK